jgi:hypothetical protein
VKKFKIKYEWSTFFGRTFVVIDPNGKIIGISSSVELAMNNHVRRKLKEPHGRVLGVH